mgnify:CR=1 FL=1|jgi:hypothetical protein|nr:MAG TPA: hypothetical protein [Caudoviricetes sp.]
MYINPTTLSNQSNKAPGLIFLSPEQEKMYLDNHGCIKVVSQEPVVVIEVDEDKLKAWEEMQTNQAIQEQQANPISNQQLRADIDYISVMTGVELL